MTEFSDEVEAERQRAWAEPHTHGKRTHSHPYGWVEHSHLMRAICHRPECVDFPTHDIHSVHPVGTLEPGGGMPWGYRKLTTCIHCSRVIEEDEAGWYDTQSNRHACSASPGPFPGYPHIPAGDLLNQGVITPENPFIEETRLVEIDWSVFEDLDDGDPE